MNATEFLEAASVPHGIQPQPFGSWRIDRFPLHEPFRKGGTWNDYTLLRHAIYGTGEKTGLHQAPPHAPEEVRQAGEPSGDLADAPCRQTAVLRERLPPVGRRAGGVTTGETYNL